VLIRPGAGHTDASICSLRAGHPLSGQPFSSALSVPAVRDACTANRARLGAPFVEDGIAPGAATVAYRSSGSATSPITRTRRVFPYPATSVYTGQGNVNDAANYVQGPPTRGVNDVFPWLGLQHYKPNQQQWCDVQDGKLKCGRNPG